MKSFDELANPHLVHAKPPAKRRRAPKYNENPTKLKQKKEVICTVYPLKVYLFPELLYLNLLPDYDNIPFYYSQILKAAGELKNDLLKIL